jgi:predicted enzyme related to lactoylglutathione lyase
MIHVTDLTIAADWYKKAFPNAVDTRRTSVNLIQLQINGFVIELVKSDDKVCSGKAGTILYWLVEDLKTEIERFILLGSEVYRGPIKIENGLGICQVTDPFGNLLGLKGSLG